jgi:hypothetical protein
LSTRFVRRARSRAICNTLFIVIRRGAWPATVIAASVLLTALLYAPTIGYGLYYDDYHFVHPYTGAEVFAAFHGPWDPAAIETAYYRPLAIGLYAVRFAAFGLDARAQHLASLGLFAAAAALFAAFAAAISRSRLAGALAAATFIVHPGMPYSAVAWITNQMHLAELILMLGACLWWFHVRWRAAAWWMPLLLFQAAAFLLKEDGIMLIPAILVLHVLRKFMVERDLPGVPWAFLGAAALTGAALLSLRAWALHGVPSHRLPSWNQAWSNWTRGLGGAFRLLPAKRPWQPEASWFVTLAPVLALTMWRRLAPGTRFAMAAGAALGVLFVLPFAFIIKAEQMHLVTAGAALLLSASLVGLMEAVPGRGPRTAMLIVALAGITAMAVVARDIMRDFEPFGPAVRLTDVHVAGWAAVPVELREYVAAKWTALPADRPDPDPSRALPLVAFGLHGRERSPDGLPLRWMAGPVADLFVGRGTRLASFPLRHERGAFGEPAHVRVEADGQLAAETVLDDGQWHRIDVVLRHARTGAGGMHRIRIRLDHAWIPARIIPGSRDGRTLGLQVGDVQLR